MKKLLSLLFTFILIFFFSFSFVWADFNREDYLNKELENLKNEFDSIPNDFLWSENFKRKSELNDKILDVTSELIKLKDSNETTIYSTKNSSYWYNNLETWDILIFNYVDPPFWSPFSWRWTHAAIVYDKNTIVEAP